jgi:hypothetical protein
MFEQNPCKRTTCLLTNHDHITGQNVSIKNKEFFRFVYKGENIF